MSELALIQEFERRLGAAGGTLPELTELRDRGHALLELFRRRRAMLDDKNALTLRLIEVERQISLYLAGLPRSPGAAQHKTRSTVERVFPRSRRPLKTPSRTPA